MKEKFINNIKSLFKSCFDNKVLFERRKNSILIPIIIFVLCVFMVSVPSYLSSNNVSSEKIMKSFPGIEKPMEKLLTYSLDCSVKDSKLICTEEADQINETVEVTEVNSSGAEKAKYTYTIIANLNAIPTTEVSYNDPKDTDNIIMLLKNYIKIRYIERDHVNETIKTYEIIGDYSNFEGYDFKQMSNRLVSSPELLNDEITSFVYNTYLSTLDTKFVVDLSSYLLSFSLFVLVTSLILKGPNLFRRKKGFKFSECFKISLTSSFPALLISILAYFMLGVDFALIFGIIYVIRIIYIYCKYILSSKNNIFIELYNQTGEERFKL